MKAGSVPARRARRTAGLRLACLFAAVAALGACSGDDGGASGAGPTTTPSIGPALTTASTAADGSTGSTGSTTSTTAYVVPEIPEAVVAEICAGAKQVVEADTKFGELLGPALSADASTEADAALLKALADAKPLIEQARTGYDRMAAVLPGGLATDAAAVRDATMTFYGQLAASQSMDALVAVIGDAQQYPDAARESAARIDATTRKTCNQSIYNA